MGDGVGFRVLGPLTVERDGSVVPVRGRIAPRLLAVLLLAAGKPVVVERLIEGVWNDEPPVTARRQVQNTASALRREFGAGVLVVAGDAYRVDLGECSLDLVEFESDLARARELTDAGDLVAAAHSLRSGLALWSGRPVSGLTGRAIDAAGERLVEARCAAVEDLSDLEHALDEASTLTGVLRDQLRENPYRQRTAARLMAALHREGATPEALAVFEEIQGRLAEDFGLDPDAELRRVHAAVVRGEAVAASIPLVRGGRSAVAATVPAQLPVNPTIFVGRQEPLTALDRLHADPLVRTCLITGAAGTGKTALVLRWGHSVSQEFPDGQIYINFRGFDHGEPLSSIEALGRCIRALRPVGPPLPMDEGEAAALLRSLLERKRVLFVLDNARDAGQVRSLLPEAPSFAVTTSRTMMPELEADGTTIELLPLDQSGASRLISEIVEPGRLRAEPAATQRITALCGNLPLALRIVAANLAASSELSLAEYADQLAKDRLQSLTIDGDSDAAVAVSLDRSYRVLTGAARTLLCQLGSIPGQDYATGMIAAAVDRPEAELRPVLDRLVNAHLLERHRDNRFRFHDLVRIYAARQAETSLSAAARDAILDRFIDWHYPQSIDYDLEEDANILVAAEMLADHPKLWKLISPLVRAVNAGNHSQELRRHIELAMASTKRHGDRSGEQHMVHILAGFLRSTEDIESSLSLALEAVNLAQELDAETLSKARSTAGVILEDLGRYHEAELQYVEALRIAPDQLDESRLINRRINLCSLYTDLGRYDEARRLLEVVRNAQGNREGILFEFRTKYTEVRNSIQAGDYQSVSTLADEIVDISVDAKHLVFECVARLQRGELHRHFGQFEAALQDLTRALETAKLFGRAVAEVAAICELAILHCEQGRRDTALDYATMLTAPRFESLPHPTVKADIALVLCIVKSDVGDHLTSRRFGERAAELYAAMPRPLFQARALAALARAHTGLHEHDKAEHFRREAIAVFDRIGVKSSAWPLALRHNTKKRP